MKFLSILFALPLFAQNTFNLIERFGVTQPAQVIDFPFTGGVRKQNGYAMTGPQGSEVGWAQRTSGAIMVRSGLPRSLGYPAPLAWPKIGDFNIGSDYARLDAGNYMGRYGAPVNQALRVGDPVLVTAIDGTAGGMTSGNIYYIQSILADTPAEGQTSYKFSSTQGGGVFDLTSTGGTVTIQRVGFVQDTSDGTGDTLWAGTHDYVACDTVKPIAYTGILPTGMSSTVYYIKSPTATSFKLSTTCTAGVPGATLDLTAASGSGVWLAETNFTWSLNTGVTAVAATNPVTISTANANYLEVSNGLVGVRIPTAAGNPNPAQTWRMDLGQITDCVGASFNLTCTFPSAHGIIAGDTVALAGSGASEATVTDSGNTQENGIWTVSSVTTFTITINGITQNRTFNSTNSPYMTIVKGYPPNLAPSQGYLVAGVWSTATNRIKTESSSFLGNLGADLMGTTDAFGILSYRTYPEESSSLRTTIVSEYVVNRPTYWYSITYTGPGIGFIIVRQTIQAGSKSILMEVDTDFGHWFKHNFYSAFPTAPNRMRWRGHQTNSTVCGYMETGGGVYLAENQRPAQDALLDISYASPRIPGSDCDATHYVPLVVWNFTTANDKGYYMQVYNTTAGSTEPVVGVYAGPASRALDVNVSGPVFNTTTNTLEIVHRIQKLNPSLGFSSRQRTSYAYFFDTKANLPASTVGQQPIGTERNIQAGINISKQNQYTLTYSDPAGGWKPLYQDQTAYNNIRSWVTDGTAKCGSAACYYNLFYTPSVTGDILNMWRNGTTDAWKNLVLGILAAYANKWMYILANADGNSDSALNHAQAGQEVNRRVGVENALLLETLTTPQKDQVKSLGAQLCSVLWDNDFAAYDNSAGDSFGSVNFPIQYRQFRAQCALFLNSQPFLATKQSIAKGYVLTDLALAINTYGAASGSTDYMGSQFWPTIMNFMTMYVNGQVACSDFPQLALHARWQASALTPPEPRFGSSTMRKWVSNGDGNTHSNMSAMMLSTLMDQCGDATSAQTAQWVWQSMNRSDKYTINDFFNFVPSALKDTITATDPSLASQHFPGYWSVLRHGWGTVNETAAWFINGSFYADHRSFDAGSTMLYAHKAPLCVKFNANLYYPSVGSSYYMCGSVTRASDIGAAWNADNPDPSAAVGSNWTPTQNDYAGFSKSSFSSATFAQSPNWTRRVQMGFGSAAYPIIRFKDTFASAVSRVLTLPMMATGNITVMGTSVAPTQRDNTGNNGVKASNGTVYAMTTNALNRIQATGATWTAHATGGIDWDVYIVPSSTSQVMVGNWSHNEHSGREKDTEYPTACATGCSFGSTFRERQHIMRVEGQGSFDTIILPWRKGTAPTQTVSLVTCPGGTAGIQIARTAPSTETECINDGEYTWSSGANRLLSVMDSASHTAFSMNISGGPGELYYNGTNVVATINGTVAAEREIDLSALAGGPWFPSIASLKIDGPINSSIYKTYHAGGAQPSSLSSTFTTSAGASSLFVYSFGGKAGTTEVVLTFSDGSKVKAPWSGAVKVRVPTGVTLSSAEYL